MQPVASTPIAFAIILLLLLRGPYKGLYILTGIIPFGMMAAINLPAVGGMSMMVSDLVVLTMLALALLRVDVGRDLAAIFSPRSVALPLLIMFAYILFATAFFPRIFAGHTEVFNLSRDANQDGIVSIPLAPSSGNISQLFRFCLSLAAFLATAIIVRRRPDADLLVRAMKLMTAFHVGLGLVDIISNTGGFAWILDPIRTANYALTLGQKMAGLNRMIGGYPEASSYGLYALGLFAFWFSYWLSARNDGKGGAGLWLALSAFALIRCTSSSAYIGFAGFYMVFMSIWMLKGQAMSRSGASILIVSLAIVPLALMAAYVAYALLPGFEAFIDRSLLNKLETDSGEERMSWNAQALKNFVETGMLGAGIGSVRASNWVAATLGSIGLPGMILYLVFFVRLFATPPGAMDRDSARLLLALKMGCLGMLMRFLVVAATPNMSIFVGFLAGAIVGLGESGRRRATYPQAERMRLDENRGLA